MWPGGFSSTATSALALYSTANPNATSTAVTSNSARASIPMRQRSRVPAMVCGTHDAPSRASSARGMSAFLVSCVEHVIAGTRRREQHDITRRAEVGARETPPV
jgi:hypothetical protein